MKNYLLAKTVWDSLSVKARQTLLHQHGRHPSLSSRSYPFIPKEIRADIQADLLKQLPPQPKTTRQPIPHWQDAF